MFSCLSASYPLCTVLYEPREGQLSVFLVSTCCLSSWSSLKPLAPIEGLSHRAVFVNVLNRTLQDSLWPVYDRADSYSHSVYSLSCCQLRFFCWFVWVYLCRFKESLQFECCKIQSAEVGPSPSWIRAPAGSQAGGLRLRAELQRVLLGLQRAGRGQRAARVRPPGPP